MTNDDTPDGGWEEYKKSMEAKGFDPVASVQVEAFDSNMQTKCSRNDCDRTRHNEQGDTSTFCCVYCFNGPNQHTAYCNERHSK